MIFSLGLVPIAACYKFSPSYTFVSHIAAALLLYIALYYSTKSAYWLWYCPFLAFQLSPYLYPCLDELI